MADSERLINEGPTQENGSKHSSRLYCLVILILIILGAWGSTLSKSDDEKSLSQTIQIENLMGRLQGLANSSATGNRAIGSGYDGSRTYVYNTLKKETNLNVTLQSFMYTMNLFLSPPSLVFTQPSITPTIISDFAGLGGSGSAVDAPVYYLSGCSNEAYANFPAGGIVLSDAAMSDCARSDRISYAANANASAILFFWSNTMASPRQYPCPSTTCKIPTFSMTLTLANSILKALSNGAVTASFSISSEDYAQQLANVIAETWEGDENTVIVQGSHLDSVPNGLGMNDNGSGSAANLELAIQFSKTLTSKYRVRFCWWAAEEVGWIGSLDYLGNLSPEERAKMVIYINYDMIGSSNYVRGIYNGRGASNPNLRPAGNAVQTMYEDYFKSQNLPYQAGDDSLERSSDHGAFAYYGIPYGGLFTGAGDIKTETEVQKYGGVWNVAHDPCYHQWCDSLTNINQPALLGNTIVAAEILQALAQKQDLKTFLAGPTQASMAVPRHHPVRHAIDYLN